MLMSSTVARIGKTMATIRTRGNKLYIDYRHLGKRVQKSTGLDDTKENRLKLEKDVIPTLLIKLKSGDFKPKSSSTFSHYYYKFLELHQEDKSYHNQVYIYKKVNAYFEKMNVIEITRLSVKEYLNTLDIKDKTKKDYLRCVKGVLDIALDDGVINVNVASSITFKRAEKEKIEIFSNDEISSLIKYADPMLRNYLAIAFYTGMRTGEILGLMRKDLHVNHIEVKRSISKGRVTTPKTVGSVRDVPMFNEVKPFIEDQLKRSESLYLFDYNKSFIKDADFFRKRWRATVKKANIPYRKMYATRHTFITQMLNSGKYKIMDIAAIVGHTSPEMILKNYAGFIRDSHLKIDTNISLFGDSLVTVNKDENLKKA